MVSVVVMMVVYSAIYHLSMAFSLYQNPSSKQAGSFRLKPSLNWPGNGVGNGNIQPITCQIWGTNTTQVGQDIQISGNGALRVVLYAPYGDVKINGNGDVMGSIVARTITLVGNAAFHYDESLRDYGTNMPFNISKWRELTSSADRARYSGVFESF